MTKAPQSTERMDFRPWREQETAAMLSICEQEEVMRYIDGPWSIERVRGFIEEEQARLVHEGVCRWAVWQKTDDKLMGFCGFVRREVGLEIGWRFDPLFWRQGYGYEAARYLVDWAFETRQADLIFAKMHVLNTASYALAEKVGMERTARFRVAEYDDFRYELSRDAWNAGR